MNLDDATPQKDRGQRTLTLFMVSKLRVEGSGEALCRVRNISAGGLMLETRMPLAPGLRIQVELRGSRALAGTVAWAHDGRAGIAFDHHVTVEELISAGRTQGRARRLIRGSHPRGPRIIVDCPIEVQTDVGRVEARLVDISQGGARLALPVDVDRDERLILMIPGLPMKLAIVRWTGEELGLAFAEPLSFDLLSEWLLVRAAGEYWTGPSAEFA